VRLGAPGCLSSRLCLLLVALSLNWVACAKEPMRPNPRYAHLGNKVIVDDSQAWSPDGRLIAYHRAFSSSYGPPGVYVVSRDGGPSRFITGGDYFGPRHLRFSPDGRRLVASWSMQLLIIDLESGNVTWPFSSATIGLDPDWSVDGRIVYTRASQTSDPADSAGIHIYDPATGVDHPLYYEGQVLFGRGARWSSDGSEVAYCGGIPPANQPMVFLARADGSALRVLVPAGMLPAYLQWYSRPSVGLDGVLFLNSSSLPQPTYYVPRQGGPLVRWSMYLGPYGAVSPDGSAVVEDFPQQPDSLKVLFLLDADDATGATRRQLTRWEPAPSQLPSTAFCSEGVEEAPVVR